MSFTAQELNRRVEIQRLVYGEPNPITGHRAETWVQVAVVFAKVEPLVGREFFAAAATQAELTVKFTMRYRADMRSADRLIFDGDIYNISAVMNIKSRNRETLVMATSLNN